MYLKKARQYSNQNIQSLAIKMNIAVCNVKKIMDSYYLKKKRKKQSTISNTPKRITDFKNVTGLNLHFPYSSFPFNNHFYMC